MTFGCGTRAFLGVTRSPDPDEALQLALVADREREVVRVFLGLRQRQGNTTDVRLICHQRGSTRRGSSASASIRSAKSTRSCASAQLLPQRAPPRLRALPPLPARLRCTLRGPWRRCRTGPEALPRTPRERSHAMARPAPPRTDCDHVGRTEQWRSGSMGLGHGKASTTRSAPIRRYRFPARPAIRRGRLFRRSVAARSVSSRRVIDGTGAHFRSNSEKLAACRRAASTSRSRRGVGRPISDR